MPEKNLNARTGYVSYATLVRVALLGQTYISQTATHEESIVYAYVFDIRKRRKL